MGPRVESPRKHQAKRQPLPLAKSSDCTSQDGSDHSEQFEETGLCGLHHHEQANSPLAEWVMDLEKAAFFGVCTEHAHLKRHESTFYCISCGGGKALCHQCLDDHDGHALLQLRRYVYEDVVNTSDMMKLMNIGEIQTYTINQAPVVFLRERPQQQQRNNNRNGCKMCQRPLKDGYNFCSIGCKVTASVKWNAPSLIELSSKPVKAAKQPAAKHQTANLAPIHHHKKQRSKSHSGGDAKRRKIEPERVHNPPPLASQPDPPAAAPPPPPAPAVQQSCVAQLAVVRACRRKQRLPRRSLPV